MTSSSLDQWRSELTFSDRLSNVFAIAAAHRALQPDLEADDVQSQARSLEIGIYDTAISKDAYEAACQALIHQQTEEQGKRPAIGEDAVGNINFPAPNEEASVPFESSLPRIAIGPYKDAQLHVDGVISSIYVASSLVSTEDGPQNGDSGLVALKVTRSSMIDVPPHHAIREGRILKRVHHGNIIPLLDSFKILGGSIVLVFPWVASNLELYLRQRTLDHSLSLQVLRGLFAGLAFLHSQGIIHRDVKPSNVLIDVRKKAVYLGDFGIAWHPKDDASEPAGAKITDVGTTSYRPPELLFGNTAYNTALDLWAAGCVAAEVLRSNHQPLFNCGEGSSELGLIKSIFSTLGTPTNGTWPEATNYPDWGKMQFADFPALPWAELLAQLTPGFEQVQAQDFVSKLVRYESGDRMHADEALRHAMLVK